MAYKYLLGKDDGNFSAVGKWGLIDRLDGQDKATGKAFYTRDVQLPGMLYGRIYTSPYACAQIKSMNTTKAEALPGVKAVLRYDDPEVPKNLVSTHDWRPQPHWVLPGKATYEGVTMGVAIAADTLDIADEALQLVEIEWEQLDFVLEHDDALKPGAPVVWPELQPYDTSKYDISRRAVHSPIEEWTVHPGDPNKPNLKLNIEWELHGSNMEQGFAEADKVIDFDFRRNETNGVGAEPLSSIAAWGEDGNWGDSGILQLWSHVQAARRSTVAAQLGIPANDIIEHFPYGGYMGGGWNWATNPGILSLPCVATLLAKKAKRPVKVMFRRTIDEWGYAQLSFGDYHCKVGVKNDGKITAVDLTIKAAISADPGKRSTLGNGHLAENTNIPHQHMDHKAAFVNKRTFTSARCEQDGNCYVVGQIFARAADAIGMDPTLVALKNDGAEGHDLAWLNAYKEEHNLPVVDSLKACIEAGKKAINWDSKWHEPGTKKLPNGRMHGLGFIWSHQWQNGAPSSVAGRQKPYLIINRNKVILSALHPDVGVNHRTGLCYIIAEAIGLKLDDVFYPHILEARWSEYETSLVAGMGSIGFSTNCWPVYAAARNLRNKILELAANQLSATPDELEIKDSVVFVKADPTKEIGVFSIRNISSTSATNDNVEAVVPSSSDIPTIEGGGIYVSRQAHFCEVEVDTDTGEVFVTKVVNCNDIGQAIVPESVNCQQDGGTVVGISKGRSEEVVYCPATGVALNTDMIGYKISTILDCGPIEPIMLQNRMGYAPYGSTGCGESNATIPCALTAIAVHNAIGKWVDSYPTSPSVVLKALGKA